MGIDAISSSIQSLTDILQQATASHDDLADKLVKIAAQNTIDISQLDTIGNVVDTYA